MRRVFWGSKFESGEMVDDTFRSEGATMLKNFHHVSITVSNINECLKLYRDLLGMEVVFDMEYKGEGVEKIMAKKGVRFRVLHLKHEENILELLQFFEPEKSQGKTPLSHPSQVGVTHIAFTVENLQGMTNELTGLGYEFLSPPVQTPSGRKVNYFLAHDGVLVELMQDPPQ